MNNEGNSKMPKYCSYCGAPLAGERSRFCTQCGRAVLQADMQAALNHTKQPEKERPPQKDGEATHQKKAKAKKRLAISVVSFCILLIAVSVTVGLWDRIFPQGQPIDISVTPDKTPAAETPFSGGSFAAVEETEPTVVSTGIEGDYAYDVMSDDTITITDYSGYDEEEVVIPKSIEGLPVTVIGEMAFEECDLIASVSMPEGITEIGYRAFGSCYSLTSVTIPKSVMSVRLSIAIRLLV